MVVSKKWGGGRLYYYASLFPPEWLISHYPPQARLDAPGALHHVIVRGIERRFLPPRLTTFPPQRSLYTIFNPALAYLYTEPLP